MTNQFSLKDAGSSYSWILESMSDQDIITLADGMIERLLDLHVEVTRERYESDIREQAESKSYPCFGATTADILNNEDEYVDYILADIEEEIAEEREAVTKYIKSRQAEIATEAALNSIMTSAEVCEEFGLNESTVRKAIERDTLQARKSGGTWLISRADAEARWSDRRIENEQYQKLLQAEQDATIEEELSRTDEDYLPADDGMAD